MNDLSARLETFLRARIPGADPIAVRDVVVHTEGFSQETFSFRSEIAGRSEHWVVKREPVSGLLEPYDLEPEFRVLHALSGDPLPSPRTPWFERAAHVLERPFYVMERLPGEVPIPVPGAGGEGPFDASERAALAPQLMRALAALHAVDWRARGLDFLGVPGAGDAAAREVARWQARIDASGLTPDPVLVEALLWLRRHAPASDHVALLHGDYRLGNWLIERDAAGPRLTGILDWEMVHLGDPIEDVAWCISHLWRGQTPRAACLAAPEDLVALYEEAAGFRVDRDVLRYYEVLAVVKMAAIMLTGIRAFRDGRTADLRMAIFDHQLPFLHALVAALRGWLPLP
ncbi:MAG: phosphotransferase family protein [Myxococcota bacterium]|nr:phosphotransferase family protein [Myxococcota bacterium]